MFYSNEEFNAQVQELMDVENYSFSEACGIVQTRMEEDEREYNEWRDEQEQIHAHDELERDHDEAYEPELNDNWYEDQYELDTDYL